MITEAFLHCQGIGPARLEQLRRLGIRNWHDVLSQTERIPMSWRAGLIAESRQLLEALEQEDIGFFVDRFRPQDKWRILSRFLDRASYFDIETSGLDCDATVSMIVCRHEGELHTFIEHENLDDFLDLLDDVELLVSFNGSAFDVPRVLDAFHIPDLPCPHLDLRWLCYHHGLQGSLKAITTSVGFERPHDLACADGQLAVDLWSDWVESRDPTARALLIRYCAADVLLLVLLAQYLTDQTNIDAEIIWKQLPVASTSLPADRQDRRHEKSHVDESASERNRLRAIRRRMTKRSTGHTT